MAKKDELNFENGSNLASGEKLKALQAAMDKIEKSFGKGSIMKMGDEKRRTSRSYSHRFHRLNVALGVGGYPRGRIIEIYGRNLPVRQPLPFMPSLKRKRQEALPHSLMQNMLSTASMQQNWVWMWTIC